MRDAKGRVHNLSVPEVDAAVATFAAQLVLGQRPANQTESTPHTLSLTQGFDRALDTGSGKYPAKTLRWQEVARARTKLERILGKSTPWASIKTGDVRRVWRTLANEYKNASPGERACGPRQAEVTVDALYSVANWLRDDAAIPPDAVLPPRKWRATLKREWEQLVGLPVAPARPRHSVEELGRLLAAMHDPHVDRRFALAFDLGGEQRLGQVLRCHRSHLKIPEPNAENESNGAAGHLGTLRVPDAGHKKAAPVVLTSEQRAAVDSALAGYLLDYEALWHAGRIKDYPLFPARRFKKGKAKVVEDPRPLTRDAALGMFHDLERIAKVTSVPGRGWYGVRRIAADVAEDVEKDERVLNSITGHRDSTTRRLVYQDRERRAVLNKAAETRELVRRNAVAGAQQPANGGPLHLVAAEKTA